MIQERISERAVGASHIVGCDDREVLIGLIYAAAADSEQWAEVFKQLQSIFAGHTAIYERLHSAPETHQLLLTDLDPDFAARYNSHYNARNVWATSPLNQAAPIVASERIIRPYELERTDFYDEWLRPQKLKHALTSPLLRQAERSLNLGLVREQRTGEYSASEAEYLGSLLPHLRRALEITSRLEAASITQRVSMDAVAAAGACLVLTDGAGRILYATPEAETMFRDGGGPLYARHGCLAGRSRQDDARLRHALAAAVPDRSLAASGRGDIFSVEAPGTGARNTVVVNPLSEAIVGLVHPTRLAAVIVGAPPNGREIAPEVLQHVLGVTKAEARLASALCAGEGLSEYSARRGISTTTSKSHLRALFSKLGVNRQTDLVRSIVGDPLLISQAKVLHKGD